MISKPTDWDMYFEYGVDVRNRRVFLIGDVDETPIGHTIKGLYMLAALSGEPLELMIGSFGGSEYEMFALYDVIQTLPAPVSTVAIGKCMSAAPLLVAAGEPGLRYSCANTQWMVHMGWGSPVEQRPDELRKLSAHLDLMNTRWYKLMGLHSNKSAAQWSQICRRVGDEYFCAERALELGLIDEIWA